MNREYHHKKTRNKQGTNKEQTKTNKNKQKQTKTNENKRKQTKTNKSKRNKSAKYQTNKKIKDNQRSKHIRPQDLIYSRLFLKVTGLFLLLSLGTDGSRIVTPRG